VKNNVKTLFAGNIDGDAGKFDKIIFVDVDDDVDDSTVVVNIA